MKARAISLDTQETTDATTAWWVTKRMLDVGLAAFGLLLAMPIMLLVMIAIGVTSRGPIFFRQTRMGRNFEPFTILKFRTMIVDAPSKGAQITAGRDPRITAVGHFLRRTKLDELPQLWNVLVGQMSFVGPRPEVPKYVELYRSDYMVLLRVRPGITDIASLKYRHESDLLGQAADPEKMYCDVILPDKIRLGAEYIRRSSLLFDAKLVMKTVLRMAE